MDVEFEINGNIQKLVSYIDLEVRRGVLERDQIVKFGGGLILEEMNGIEFLVCMVFSLSQVSQEQLKV